MRFKLLRGDFIMLNQLLKAAGVDEDYIRIRHLIRSGKVSVNDETILRVEHEVRIGDTVRCLKHHIIVTGKEEEKEKELPQENVRHGKINRWDYKPLQEERALNRKLEEVTERLHHKLLNSKLKLALAESCTGGMIQAAVTSQPGSSKYFVGGIVSYSNQSKEEILAVKPRTLEREGAVSRQTAAEMAKGARNRFGSDLAGSVTGIAGPGGGTDEKPVGTVFLAVDHSGRIHTRQLKLKGNRDMIRKQSAIQLLYFILDQLK